MIYYPRFSIGHSGQVKVEYPSDKVDKAIQER